MYPENVEIMTMEALWRASDRTTKTVPYRLVTIPSRESPIDTIDGLYPAITFIDRQRIQLLKAPYVLLEWQGDRQSRSLEVEWEDVPIPFEPSLKVWVVPL